MFDLLLNLQVSKKNIALIGNFYFLLMLLFSIVFFNERAYFLDQNWMLYLITKAECIQVQEMRLGSFITHLWPVIGLKLQLSLDTIQQLYNASFLPFLALLIF